MFLLDENRGNIRILENVYRFITTLLKVLHSLMVPNFARCFEIHIEKWANAYHVLLTDDSLPSTGTGELELLRYHICCNLELVFRKYHGQVDKYIGSFMTDISELIANASQETKYDKVRYRNF